MADAIASEMASTCSEVKPSSEKLVLRSWFKADEAAFLISKSFIANLLSFVLGSGRSL